MEGDKNFKENGPPESSLAPIFTSPHVDASKPQDSSNGELDVSKSAPSVDLISLSPVAGHENGVASPKDPVMPVDSIFNKQENKEPAESVTSFLESMISTTSEAKPDSDQRRDDDVSNGQAFQQDNSLTSDRNLDTMNHRKEDTPVPKIVARPSPEDDFVTSFPSPQQHRRSFSVDLVAKIPTNYNSSPQSNAGDLSRGQIDTAAPFESVKAAVSKFGGIVDWKAHRVHTVERRKFIEKELEKAQEEMPTCKQQCQAAEAAKTQVLKELDSTKRLIEELKLNLERAQTEEQQAKQDSELAKLRVEEMEQGIADESSFAAKAQLEVAKARHAAAVSELKTVKEELEQLRKDFALLIAEKDAAVKKAEEATATSREVEKSVEDLTIELITVKQALESAHSAHLEAEEHRIGAVMAKEQDTVNWEEELKEAEEELDKLNQQMLSTKELKSKLSTATSLLQDLKAELANYMESKSVEEGSIEDALREPEKKTRRDIEAAINAAKNELISVKLKIERANEEVKILKMAALSLTSELEKEKSELTAVQQREGMASIAIASLESELNKTTSEIALAQMKEKEESERMGELPKQLQEAAQEADRAKELAKAAKDDLQKASEEAEQAKASTRTKQSQLRAVEKEIEAAKACEKLALAAINALEESESAQKEKDSDPDSPNGITLSLEEYYELSKRAHEAEEQANARVAAALSQIEVAKESETRSLNKLEQVSHEMSEKKDALEMAVQKADQAQEGKLLVEQELRKWRSEGEQRRKGVETVPAPVNTTSNGSFDNGKESNSVSDSSSNVHQRSSPKSMASNAETEFSPEPKKKKKKSFFPRFFMFLGRRKAHHSSKTA